MHSYVDAYSGKRKSSAYFAKMEHKRRLAKLCTEAHGMPVVWSDYAPYVSGIGCAPANGAFMKRKYRSPQSAYYQRAENRRVRHGDEALQNADYRKACTAW